VKTPRETLLEHHRHANAELDAVRQCVVEQECGAGVRRTSRWVELWATRPWDELVLPCRRAWLGLAAAWVLIVGLNITQTRSVNGVHDLSMPAIASVASLLAEQAQLRAELLGLSHSLSPASEAGGDERQSGPRSERSGKVNRVRLTGSGAGMLCAPSGPRVQAWARISPRTCHEVRKVRGDV